MSDLLHLSPTGRYLRYGENAPHGPNLADFEVFGGPEDERLWRARRLLLCWNLLDGVPTSFLEKLDPGTLFYLIDNTLWRPVVMEDAPPETTKEAR